MSTFSQKDLQLLFVGGAATATTGAIDAMNDGEIGIFTPAGTRITEATAATATKFIIVKKTANGGVPLVSPVLNKADLTLAKRTIFAAATEQVTTVGYDGTTGSIEAINDNEYHLRISLRQGYTSNHGGLYLKHAFYKSDVNATELEIASAIVKDATANLSKDAEAIAIVSLLCNNAGTSTTGTVDVVKGSYKAVASVPGDFEVGGVLRLGTATTSPVYKIVSIAGDVLTLDTKVNEASAQYAIAAAEAVSAADSIAASYGVKLTGVASKHVVGKLHGDLMPNAFDVTLENFGSTAAVVATAASAGNGTEKQVAELEWFCQGNEGDFHRMGEPNVIARRTEVSGNYDLIDLRSVELYTDSITVGPVSKEITLAIPATAPNYAIAGTSDDITDVLEVLAFGSATGALAVS